MTKSRIGDFRETMVEGYQKQIADLRKYYEEQLEDIQAKNAGLAEELERLKR